MYWLFTLSLLCLLSACAGAPMDQRVAEVPLATVPLASAQIIDARARFRQVFCHFSNSIGTSLPDHRNCEEAIVRLAGEADAATERFRAPLMPKPRTLVFLPGLFGECVREFASPFADSYDRLQKAGFKILTAPLEGRSSSVHNARLLGRFLVEAVSPGEELIVIAHSKGAVDFLHAASSSSSAWYKQIRGFISVAGAILGSPIADDFESLYANVFARMPWPGCGPGDGDALRSITRRERSLWMSSHSMPIGIRMFSVSALPLSTPVNSLLWNFNGRLSRIDARNDGQLIFGDTLLPNSTFLGAVNADHWSIALPFNRSNHPMAQALSNQNAFPREVLLESLLSMVEEALADSP